MSRYKEFEIPGNIRQKYEQHYRSEKSHSPDASTISILRRMHLTDQMLGCGDIVLDLGAGRQNIERAYMQSYGRPDFHFVTFDLAYLKKRQLLAGASPAVSHFQSDAKSLPLRDESVSLAVSNMAIDFITNDGVSELARVMKPNAKGVFNLCFPALDLNNLPNIDDIIRSRKTPSSKRRELQFWKTYLEENDILFTNKEDVTKIFTQYGFTVGDTKYVENPYYDWFEVNVQKQAVPVENQIHDSKIEGVIYRLPHQQEIAAD